MTKSMLLHYGTLEQWTKNPDIINLVVGTGALAKDMQTKLRLLNLDAPFLIGDRDDEDAGIRHYSVIETLEDPKRYRFIVCCDLDEWTIIGQVLPRAFKLNSGAVANHPRVVQYSCAQVFWERGGREVLDAWRGSAYLKDGKPFEVFGDTDRQEAFHIHILGSCHADPVRKFATRSIPERLYEMLRAEGYDVVVHGRSRGMAPSSDVVFTHMAEACCEKNNLTIFFNTLSDLQYATSTGGNLLSPRGNISVHPMLAKIRAVYQNEKCDGFEHASASPMEILVYQSRVLAALSKRTGGEFWDIITPAMQYLPEKQALEAGCLSPGYYARRRGEKDEFLSQVAWARDYTGCFLDVENIFSAYTDSLHFSNIGIELVAERLAREIITEFGCKMPRR